MPDPVRALSNISRVLKPQGLLIAPSYSQGHISDSAWNLSVGFLKLIGFQTYTRWTPEEYIAFIRQNGFRVEKRLMLSAAFPLVYLES
jgi:ubiquinone/menaquinone biosynthesis C-methylase UbiE